MNCTNLTVLSFLLLVPSSAASDAESPQLYKVIRVIDGDTIDVLAADRVMIRLRFNGIDAPERGQPFGNNAKQYLSKTIGGKMVRLRGYGLDKYNRSITDIYLPVENAPDLLINRELVKRGLAWHYKEFSDNEALAEDERRAQREKIGLWGGSHKIFAPWDWRDLSKDERDLYR